MLKLVASNGAQSYVPLTLRDDSSHAALVIQNSVTTWQAYNDWGGYSLYHGAGRLVRCALPCGVVRPSVPGRRGSADFFWIESPWCTCRAAGTRRHVLDRHRPPRASRAPDASPGVGLARPRRVLVERRCGAGRCRARSTGSTWHSSARTTSTGTSGWSRRPLGKDRREVNYKVGVRGSVVRSRQRRGHVPVA